MKNLTIKYEDTIITLRPYGPMSQAIHAAYAKKLIEIYGGEDNKVPYFINIFLLLVPHTRGIEGGSWKIPEVSDMALMPGGLTLTNEEVALHVREWGKFTDENLELYELWVEAVDAFYRAKDEDLGPKPLDEEADPNAGSGG
jgi:hypothetical protein